MKVISFCATVFCLALTSPFCMSQHYVRDFRDVRPEDFTISSPLVNDTTEAIVLFDKGRCFFDESERRSLDIVFERHIRIKILNEKGLEWARDITLCYYMQNGLSERIKAIEGYTYNYRDGKIVESQLNSKVVEDKEHLDHFRRKVFSMPDIQVGSIIEYRYTLETPFRTRLVSWYFQAEIPTAISQYEVALTPFRDYAFMLKGATEFSNYTVSENPQVKTFGTTQYNEKIYFFEMRDVPAYVYQAYPTPADDYLIHIDFETSSYRNVDGKHVQLMTSWSNIISLLSSHVQFGGYIKDAERFAKSKSAPQFSSADGDLRLAKEIIKYVKQNYEWDEISGIYTASKARQVAAARRGSVAEINLLLLGLLTANGLEAEPVLISTRAHGPLLKEYPFVSSFNYVVLRVNAGGEKFLVDGTQRFLAFNRLPTKCLNGGGLLAREGETEWVPLTASGTSNFIEQIQMTIMPQLDSVQSSIRIGANGYMGETLRMEVEDNVVTLSETVKDYNLSSISDFSSSNYLNPEESYQVEFRAKSAISRNGDTLRVDPFIKEAPQEQMFRPATRQTPVDMMYTVKRIFVSEIAVPEGYEVAQLPVNFTSNSGDFVIDYKIERIAPSQVKVTGMYQRMRSFYPAEEYPALKDSYDAIVRVFNQKIVLVKAKGGPGE